MALLQQAGAAVLLLSITLSLQCGGAAALILWIRSIPRESERLVVLRCAALVMQTTVAVIVLHGIVILLWASCYRGLCLPSWGIGVLLFGEQLRDGWIRGCGSSVEVAPVGPARKYGRHADVRSIHRTSVRSGHSSGRRRLALSSTTSLRTRECSLHRSPTKAKLLLRTLAVEGHILRYA